MRLPEMNVLVFHDVTLLDHRLRLDGVAQLCLTSSSCRIVKP